MPIQNNAIKVPMVLKLIPDKVQSEALVLAHIAEDGLTLSIIKTCLEEEYPTRLWSDHWQKMLNTNTLCVGILHAQAAH
ncbi:hypothetical protein GGI24_004106 [Coemansia furcata]|nr:hypothetical protein GGI24_004106 [Coemansia furcata]